MCVLIGRPEDIHCEGHGTRSSELAVKISSSKDFTVRKTLRFYNYKEFQKFLHINTNSKKESIFGFARIYVARIIRR